MSQAPISINKPSMAKDSNRMNPVLGAFYARVSSDQQAQEQTIDSQVAALRERIAADGVVLEAEFEFLDDGVSGTTLTRPALERLRDAAYAGSFQKLYVHSPDRLARKYAYQVLLLEELRRHGVEVVFLNRPIGVSPEEDLLLQMQGMFAEYERAKILERSRRGKRHAAQRGSVNVLSGAPFGYRYVSKHEGGGIAAYEVVPEQAAIVSQIFEWVGRDRLSIGAVCRRLKQQGTLSPSGNSSWDHSSVWSLLKNPAFYGHAAFGKTRVGERRPQQRAARRCDSKASRRAISIYDTSTTEQVVIDVPPIVSKDLFVTVQTQLTTNQHVSRERRTGARNLLQGLVTCGCCRYAFYGKLISGSAAKGKARYVYYRCVGTDSHRFGGQRICQNKQVRADVLEEAVWHDAEELLRDPQLLRKEYERRLQTPSQDAERERTLRQQEQSAKRAVSRLIDAFTEGILSKSEFEPRLAKARERTERLTAELAQIRSSDAEQAHLRAAMACLDEFTSRIGQGLDQADWNARREILRLLIERIYIESDQIRIVYRISFPLFLQTSQTIQGSTARERILHFCWRSDHAHGWKQSSRKLGDPGNTSSGVDRPEKVRCHNSDMHLLVK
jgi:site-specific DNA recombinase